jgi:hypothetical protein
MGSTKNKKKDPDIQQFTELIFHILKLSPARCMSIHRAIYIYLLGGLPLRHSYRPGSSVHRFYSSRSFTTTSSFTSTCIGNNPIFTTALFPRNSMTSPT